MTPLYPGYIETKYPAITQDQLDQYVKDFSNPKKSSNRKRPREDVEDSQPAQEKSEVVAKNRLKNETKNDPYRTARSRELIKFFKEKVVYYGDQILNLRAGKPLKEDVSVFRAVSKSGLKLGSLKVNKNGITVSVDGRRFSDAKKQSTYFPFQRNITITMYYQAAKALKREFIKELRQEEVKSYYTKLQAKLLEEIKSRGDKQATKLEPVTFSSKVLKFDLGVMCVNEDNISVGNVDATVLVKVDEFRLYDDKKQLTDIGRLFKECQKLQTELDKISISK